MKPRTPRAERITQQGFMLLEVLIALLIFSLGVLGLVGLQTRAIQQSGDAKYRADATMLAADLIGQMQVSARTYGALNTGFSSTANSTAYQAWKARVEAALPNAANYTQTVTVTQQSPLPALLGGGTTGTATDLTASSVVTITVQWLAPSASSADGPRKLTVRTQIK